MRTLACGGLRFPTHSPEKRRMDGARELVCYDRAAQKQVLRLRLAQSARQSSLRMTAQLGRGLRGRTLEGFGHLVEDGLGGGGGVLGLGDGAADDQVACAVAEGLGGGGDALLVADAGSGGADAGDDENACWAGEGAEGCDLLRGADEASDAGGDAHAGEQLNLGGRGAVKADGGGLGGIHAGEDGDGEELGWVGQASKGFIGGGEHGRAAGGVDGEHVHAEGSGGADGSGDGVGDVVEFEVEEDGMAALEEGLEDGGSGGDEELKADFEP